MRKQYTNIKKQTDIMNIIIVDDDRQAAEVLKKKLTEYHEMNVVGMAHDGKEGLQLFKEAMPDLLFLDIDMRVCHN